MNLRNIARVITLALSLNLFTSVQAEGGSWVHRWIPKQIIQLADKNKDLILTGLGCLFAFIGGYYISKARKLDEAGKILGSAKKMQEESEQLRDELRDDLSKLAQAKKSIEKPLIPSETLQNDYAATLSKPLKEYLEKPTKGMTLIGPSHSDKMHLIRCFAGSMKAPVITVNSSDIHQSSYIGKPLKLLADPIMRAKQMLKTTPRVIVVLENIDLIFGASKKMKFGFAFAFQTLAAMFVNLFNKAPDGLIFIGCANDLAAVQKSITAADVLGTHIHLESPNTEERAAIFEHYLKKSPVPYEHIHEQKIMAAECGKWAELSRGLSRQDIKACIDQAITHAQKRATIFSADGHKLGKEQSQAEQKNVAYKEATRLPGQTYSLATDRARSETHKHRVINAQHGAGFGLTPGHQDYTPQAVITDDMILEIVKTKRKEKNQELATELRL